MPTGFDASPTIIHTQTTHNNLSNINPTLQASHSDFEAEGSCVWFESSLFCLMHSMHS